MRYPSVAGFLMLTIMSFSIWFLFLKTLLARKSRTSVWFLTLHCDVGKDLPSWLYKSSFVFSSLPFFTPSVGFFSFLKKRARPVPLFPCLPPQYPSLMWELTLYLLHFLTFFLEWFLMLCFAVHRSTVGFHFSICFLMYSQWVSWYLHRALCLAFLCVLILLISSDSSYVCYTLPRDSLEFVVLFLLLHSAGVCLGYQLQLCWSHVYAPLFYILLFFPFFFLPLSFNCPGGA